MNNFSKYILIRGFVTSLEIKRTRMELNVLPKIMDGIAVVEFAQAVLEASGDNPLSASVRENEDIEMEYFKCLVSGEQLVGNFYKVGFSEGEEIEFVVERLQDCYGVCSACSESQRLVWTLPNQIRGNIAQIRADISGSFACSIIFALIFLAFAYFVSNEFGARKWQNMKVSFFMAFTIIFLLNAITRLTFYRFSKEATKIFALLGFLEPESVDLLKNHKAADSQYISETGSEAVYHPAWQFRYCASQRIAWHSESGHQEI